MTLNDMLIALRAESDFIRSDEPLHRSMLKLCEDYIYETVRLRVDGRGV